ncbi:MAG: ABC transporter permease [Caldilineaceae bacterium]|nr:ABC transporter permease [Caldilineaceae bacterium]
MSEIANMNGFWAIIIRDLKRLRAQPIRVVSGIAQPLLYLFLLGSGLGGAVRQGEEGYLQYIFPGVVALSLLFTATFSAISIVFDREIGFLKAVLVAPVSRRSIALGKVASGAIIAVAQACLLLVAAPFAGVHFGLSELLLFLLFMLLGSVVFSALGVAVAANFSSTEVFPVVLNALLLPLFFISGALFPLDSAPGWLQVVAYADPVAYGVDLLRGAVLGEFYFPRLLSLAVLSGAIAVLTWLAVIVFERGSEA